MTQRIFMNLFVFWIVNDHPQIITEYISNQCYIKSSNSNSAICRNTLYSPASCGGSNISVTAMTMYVVCRCNSTSQCDSGQACCSTETNETKPVEDNIKMRLYACTTEQCLTISLYELPKTGAYYQILKIMYSCVSKTNFSESTTSAVTGMISTSRTSPADTSVCQTNEKDADEDAGFPIAGVVIIPLVIVLIVVVIGLVWRYRRRIFGKQKKDNLYTETGGTCGHVATTNKTYDASFVTKTTDEHSAYYGESGFNDYSEMSTIETSISTNHETEYNVLNLKSRSVKSDPNYGILSARPIDPDTFYSQVQKKNAQGDTYSHIGRTYKGEGDKDSTYDSTHVVAKDKAGLTDNKEEDTYNHI